MDEMKNEFVVILSLTRCTGPALTNCIEIDRLVNRSVAPSSGYNQKVQTLSDVNISYVFLNLTPSS